MGESLIIEFTHRFFAKLSPHNLRTHLRPRIIEILDISLLLFATPYHEFHFSLMLSITSNTTATSNEMVSFSMRSLLYALRSY